ncbi:hypothetical protein SCALIN_C22_0089 [Candidatus Scalindua japonica]|uniref:Uncharacterized protein n=1 Tax=Candidatus Scalindua japonica TaxID=1284222 RepID=A0A286TZP9_9BACT|nr:hypothetical protein [Candidatus Scalindua japonica]GAX61379.1 hypothetical protein SCALIN_C22_0089 [Candidatus Scalindua japonica]
MKEYSITDYSTSMSNGTDSTSIHFYDNQKARGEIRFFPNETDVKDAEIDANGKIILNMDINRLGTLLDIAQRERNLFLFYADGKRAGLRSGRAKLGDDSISFT